MKTVEVIKATANIIDRSKGIGQGRQLRVAPYRRVSTDDEEQLDSYRSQMQYYTDIVQKNPNWARVEVSLTGDNVGREIEQLKHEIQALEVKKNKLLDMRLEEMIEKDDYELKYSEISATIRKYNARLDELTESDLSRKSVQNRIVEFRKVLQEHNTMTKFDRAVFESVVEAVIIGGYNERGEKDPTQISFVYKMGYKKLRHTRERKRNKNKCWNYKA